MAMNGVSSIEQSKKNIISDKELIIVTGLSGAGKTGVVRVLEDLDYYCIDNLPVPMIQHFLDCIATQHALSKVVLGIDIRGKEFFSLHVKDVLALKNSAWKVTIIFLDASEATLLKRFQETRRRHPFESRLSLPEAIASERKLLDPLMQQADLYMNTDHWNLHDLRKWALSYFNAATMPDLLVNFISFGFKYGIPLESNAVYDLRPLPNPFFIPHLRPLHGKDAAIQEYLFNMTEVQEYWNYLVTFIKYSLKKTYEEGRFSATISIGCTGGKHRSVAFVERLIVQGFSHVKAFAYHRDIEK